MRVVQRVLSRREKIDQLLANLDVLRDRGEVRDDEFESLASDYAKLRAEAELNVDAVREQLRNKERGLREHRRELDDEMRTLSVREKVGEVTAAQADRARRRLESQISADERKMMRLEAALNAQSSADAGGYVDVDVRARVELSSGVWGDELEAPEFVGAAHESMKEWQGRAHELVASARVRGKELLDREEMAAAKSTLRTAGGRALAQLDSVAERTTAAVNAQLSRRGLAGISSAALKVIALVIVLVLFLAIMLRDSYPSSPTGVLESAWEAANAGRIADTEQYLSATTLGWVRETIALLPGKNTESMLRARWDQRTRRGTFDHLEIQSEEIAEGRASVHYVVYYTDGSTSGPHVDQFVLEDNHWKLESRLTDLF